MPKDYCPICNGDMDSVEYTEGKMCESCYMKPCSAKSWCKAYQPINESVSFDANLNCNAKGECESFKIFSNGYSHKISESTHKSFSKLQKKLDWNKLNDNLYWSS